MTMAWRCVLTNVSRANDWHVSDRCVSLIWSACGRSYNNGAFGSVNGLVELIQLADRLNSTSTPICCCRRAPRWIGCALNSAGCGCFCCLRRVGVVLPSLGDAIQRSANSIAGDRDDLNSSSVRREFGRRCGTCQVHSTSRIYTDSVTAGNYSVSVLTVTLLAA